MSTRKKGQLAEKAARSYLERQGLIWLASNYTCRVGEIDLIMEASDGELVFVEVRSRNSGAFGGAVESITYKKKQKLLKTASHYLMTHPLNGYNGVRFDVVAFEGLFSKLNWIKQAFEA